MHIFPDLFNPPLDLIHICPTAAGNEMEQYRSNYTVTKRTNHSCIAVMYSNILGEVHVRRAQFMVHKNTYGVPTVYGVGPNQQ